VRRAFLLLGLTLLAVAGLAPALEAVGVCAEQCVDEGPGSGCAADQCCSCCVHIRLVKADRPTQADPPGFSCRIAALSADLPLAADPGEILHIPKPASA
jgi:hypothetical protein